MDAATMLSSHFATLPDLIRAHAAERGDTVALAEAGGELHYAALDDRFDLSAFRLETCTSAPFSAALEAEVPARWPGLLVEYYGMTEGGRTCVLVCNQFPDKPATGGQPVEGRDIRLIDDDREVAQGEMGEVVGRSPAMMTGYHGRTEAFTVTEWHDADGFLTLLDRKLLKRALRDRLDGAE